MENPEERIYKNLLTILKLFQNRPYHLAKYLIENEALNLDFLEKIKNSQKLNKINNEQEDNSIQAIYFIDISHMKDFFNSFTDNNYDDMFTKKSDDVTELNNKLDRLIREEKYEEAARIRDYMQKNNIERKKD